MTVTVIRSQSSGPVATHARTRRPEYLILELAFPGFLGVPCGQRLAIRIWPGVNWPGDHFHCPGAAHPHKCRMKLLYEGDPPPKSRSLPDGAAGLPASRC